MRKKTAWTAVAFLVVATVLAPGAVHAAPPTPNFGPAIDGYAAYDGQDTCDPSPKPGVVHFKDLLEQTYGREDLGISRACDIGGISEHKEGRALDYPFNAFNSTQLAQAQDLLSWLLATDQYGNQHALARRLGIMYIVWNGQQWRAYRPDLGWQPYSGSNPHTDHIHFSFSWAGALMQTTWWTGRLPDLYSGALIQDFDGDGNTDIIWRNATSKELMLLRGNGAGGYLDGGSSRGIGGFGIADIIFSPGDFDGDGNADIIWRNAASKELMLLRGNGAGGYLDGGSSRGIGGFGIADMIIGGDFSGDGNADIIWRNAASKELMLLRGNGAGGYLDGGSSRGIGGFGIADRIL